MSIQAYQKVAQRAETPKETEYRVFARVTRELIEAREAGRTTAFQAWFDALDQNRKLWTLLARECAERQNRLPDGLRAQIISLAIFVDRHTSQVLRAGEAIDPLIDINRTIMEGLAAAAPGR